MCDAPENSGDPDLCQQWRMAEAANQLHRDTVVGIVVGAVGGLATIAAAIAALVAASAARDSVSVAQETAKRQLRAYINMTDWNIRPKVQNGIVVAWLVNIKWRNEGATPTRVMMSGVGMGALLGSLPTDFFDSRNPIVNRAVEADIGPKGYKDSASMMVMPEEIEAVRTGYFDELFFWGRIEYGDVFPDTERHFTQFCAHLVPLDHIDAATRTPFLVVNYKHPYNKGT